MSNDRTSLFVEVQPWVFERREVETDYQEGATAIIKSGLEARRARDREGGVVLND
jgi:membrane fusion protein, heavy metal efflux system